MRLRARDSLAGAAIAVLSACRLVAGIEDFQITGAGADGGPSNVTTLVTASSGDAVSSGVAMFVSSGFVYVVAENSIWRCATAGCAAPEVLVPTFAGLVRSAALVGSEIYFTTNEGGGSIRAVGTDGKNARVFSAVKDVQEISSDGAQVFFATMNASTLTGQVLRCPIGASCATPTVVMDSLDQATVFAHAIVWNGSVYTNVNDSTGTAFEKLVSCGLTATCGTNPKSTTITGDFDTVPFHATPTRLLFLDGEDLGSYDVGLKRTIAASSKDFGGTWVAGDDKVVVSGNLNGDAIVAAPLVGPPKLTTLAAKQAATVSAAVVDSGFVYFVVKSAGVSLYRVPTP